MNDPKKRASAVPRAAPATPIAGKGPEAIVKAWNEGLAGILTELEGILRRALPQAKGPAEARPEKTSVSRSRVHLSEQ